jgi:hypothetical protein
MKCFQIFEYQTQTNLAKTPQDFKCYMDAIPYTGIQAMRLDDRQSMSEHDWPFAAAGTTFWTSYWEHHTERNRMMFQKSRRKKYRETEDSVIFYEVVDVLRYHVTLYVSGWVKRRFNN